MKTFGLVFWICGSLLYCWNLYISREEQEIRNIWFSYINLECTYGGSSSLDDILKRFMKHNDRFPALCHLLKVFEKCQKWEVQILICCNFRISKWMLFADKLLICSPAHRHVPLLTLCLFNYRGSDNIECWITKFEACLLLEERACLRTPVTSNVGEAASKVQEKNRKISLCCWLSKHLKGQWNKKICTSATCVLYILHIYCY